MFWSIVPSGALCGIRLHDICRVLDSQKASLIHGGREVSHPSACEVLAQSCVMDVNRLGVTLSFAWAGHDGL